MEILSIISIIVIAVVIISFIVIAVVIAVDCWIMGFLKELRKKAMEQKGLSEEEIKQSLKDFIEADPGE